MLSNCGAREDSWVPWTARRPPINPKGNQSWRFIGRTDIEAPILWPPDEKSQLTRKDPVSGKDWRQRRRGWQRIRWLDSITDSTDINLSNSRKQWRTEEPSMLQSMRFQRIGDDLVTEQQRQTSYIQRNKEKNDKFLWENKANEKIGKHL